ncbi:MAG: hypothetical protein NTW89_05335 [Burkholderiales bacterium]|nr:hypothetical protein [Burkholderiales bacterium]
MAKLFKTLVGISSIVLGCSASVMAQDVYPSKAIKLIVPLGAGGATDVVARVVAGKLSQRLGQQVVVELAPVRPWPLISIYEKACRFIRPRT